MSTSRLCRWGGAAVLCFGLLSWVAPAMVLAEQEVELYGKKYTLFGEGQIGLQLKEFSEGTRTSKFEEYQDVARGFTFDLFQFGLEGKDSPFYLRGSGRKISRDDQSFELTFGKYGELQVNFSWDEIPHFFSTGSKTLLTQTSSTNFVFNNVGDRQTFTTNDPTSPPAAADAGDAATANLARQLVNNAPSIDLSLHRQRAKGDILYTLYPMSDLKWNFRFHIDNEDKNGNRALSTGVYERRPVAGLGDTYRVVGIELPEPISHHTTQVGFGTDLAGDGWVANLGYEYVNFTNDASFLRWQNPFNNTDELAPGNGDFNRGRFAQSQIDLFPDNHSHSITGSGSISLPFKTQFTGNLSSTWIFQNDRFLPYTLNTAILATNVPGSPQAATLALPKSSLDGEIRTLTQSYALTNRAIPNTTLNAFYRYYDYDNHSPSILFPGYAAAADSFWRINFGVPPAAPAGTPPIPIENEPKSYTKQHAGLDASWHALRSLTFKAGYEYERWDRTNRETDATNEHIAKVSLDFKPLQWLLAKASYRHGERQFEGTYVPGLEFSGLRKFDQANRTQNVAETMIQVTPIDTLAFSGSFSYLNNDFDDTFSGQKLFGLKQQHEYSLGVDANYTPLQWMTLYGYYVHEFGKFEMRNISKTGTTNFNSANEWDSSSDDRTQSLGAGLNATLIPNRLTLNLGYNYSLAKGKILTSNPNTIQAAFSASSQAFPFPDTKSQLHSLKAILNYAVNKNISIGTRYTFEQYRLNDFAWDILQPYLFPISPTTSPVADNPVRFLILDSRYSNYDVHVFGGFLNVRF